MNWQSLPWLEITIAVPLLGAAVTALSRDRDAASRRALFFLLVTFCVSVMPWMLLGQPSEFAISLGTGRTLLAVDGLSAPLLPLVALLHTLTVLCAPRAEASRSTLSLLLLGNAIRLATFAAIDALPLALLLSLGVLIPLWELVLSRKTERVFVWHMSAFVLLLLLGVAVREIEPWGPNIASVLLMMAVLIRSGTFPMHLWVGDLFEKASFGSALLFMAPLSGVYAAVRLLLPIAPDWVLQGIGSASLFTAIYCSALATVQRDVRRFLGYLFLSYASMVLVGLELHTAMSLTGALCLWVSVALSLGGMGLTLRALEARFGRLSMSKHHGLYEQSPTLAVSFLLTGLGSVGFPGTLGFVAAELLADGVVSASLFTGIVLVIAAALNGIAILRAYLLLFTGTQHESSTLLGITPLERFAVLLLTGLILGGGLFPHPGVADRHAAATTLLAGRAPNSPNESHPEAK